MTGEPGPVPAALPVVLVHGMRVSGGMWQAVAERLRVDRPGRVVATPDLPGHGTRRGEPFTMEGAVAAVLAAVDEVGGRALVVGHSLGGGAVTVAAARHPDAVAGVVGIGCTFPVGRGAAWGAHLYRAFGSWVSRPGPTTDRLSHWLFHRMLPPEVAEATIAGGLSGEAVTAVTDEVMGVDWLAEAARYRGPLWLINGGFDQFRGGERRWLAAAPDARLVVWPRLNHLSIMGEVDRLATFIGDACTVAAASSSSGPACSP